MSDARNRNRLGGWLRRQHGIVARGQLLALGVQRGGDRAPRSRDGRLHPVVRGDLRGRLAVPRPAAPLDGGRPRRRRGRSAQPPQRRGALGDRRRSNRVLRDRRRASATTLRTAPARGPASAARAAPRAGNARSRLRRRPSPVTSPVQTLIDLATELDSLAVERAVNDADKRDLIDPESLRRGPRSPRRRARRAPTARPPRHAHLPSLRLRPRDLLPPASPRREPPPAAQQTTASTTSRSISSGPTWAWLSRRTACAITALPRRSCEDARRDRAHVHAGMTPLRFTHYEIKHEARPRPTPSSPDDTMLRAHPT